ncbi:MAG TPA: polyribonucleotide nucleotidyltransferase [Candidatus Omnitrophota bacterium]|nr:polyribonucleotide nucleotidyltransferase [Candidatus Omnitrophota bacterium]
MDFKQVETQLDGKKIIIESGKLAKQANGAVTVTCGGTVVLVAACMSEKPKAGADFLPLMVEYQEKVYSAGRIPGGFFKREGRPTEKETLTARIIDRPIRPLFPEGFYYDVVVTCNVISSDGENDPDVLAAIGASSALHISDIPFDGPVAAVRVGMKDGQFIINPGYAEREESLLELFVVGSPHGIVMIEGEGKEVPEEKVAEGLKFAETFLKELLSIQDKLRGQAGKEKAAVTLSPQHTDLKEKISLLCRDRLNGYYELSKTSEKEKLRKDILADLLKDLSVYQECAADGKEVTENDIRGIFDVIESEVIRTFVLDKKKRFDGRALDQLRPLSSEVNILPRTHGSALFSRGQTQSMAVVTLGTRRDEQMIEGLQDLAYNNFMLHYNFPSFSVGEARPSRGPGRREIGHGALAAKALKAVLPTKEEFPYTVRVVSEILESNGSSSMASVCSGCLSLMDAGVPITNPVAGISVGLVSELDKDRYELLTDIIGMEDHHGDMDYKIAGSKKGVTAIQLDLKIKGLPMEILIKGMDAARKTRMLILDHMLSVIAAPKSDISEYAPRIVRTEVPQDKIGEVIGPGGKMIKRIMEETGAESIDIDDDGKVLIAAFSKEAAQKAVDFINGLIQAPEIGKIYDAVVVKVQNFGAFCEFLPGKQGLMHVSEFSNEFVKDLSQVVKVGDRFKVKLTEIDQMRRCNLSKKQAEAK